MFTAFAETVTETVAATAAVTETVAETATNATASVSSLGITSIIFLVLGLYVIVKGFASLVSGKSYGMGKDAAKYTDESLKAYSPFEGVSSILLGLAILLLEAHKFLPALEKTIFTIGSFKIALYMVIALALIVVALVIIIPASKKLVKKDQQ